MTSGSGGIAFIVRTEGAERVARALYQLQLSAADMSPALREIGAALVTSTQRRFEDEAGPDGAPWTKSARAERQGGSTLRDSGRLFRAGRSSVEVGTNVIYARIHQLGGAAGRGHAIELPARPFLGLDGEDEREIQAIVHDYLWGHRP